MTHYAFPPGLTDGEKRAFISDKRRKWRMENLGRVKGYSQKWRAENPEKERAYKRDWYVANKDRHTEQIKRWRAANPEKMRVIRREAKRRWAERNPEKAAVKAKAKKVRYYERYPEKRKVEIKRKDARYREANPDKVAARKAIQRAVAAGRLARGCCRVCGKPEAEAHHADYAKPFEVDWLCNDHHRAEHTRMEIYA